MWRMATIVILGLALGCAAKSPPPPPPPPPESQWSWGEVSVLVKPFENRTGIRVAQRTKKGTRLRQPIEQGMTQQLAWMLEQSKAFDVLGYHSTQDDAEAQGAERETDKAPNGKGGEETGEAQLEVSGSITVYSLSPVSVAGGVSEDPLLRVLQDDPSVQSAFKLLAERAGKTDEDQISFNVRFMDTKTKIEIGNTSFQCTAKDWGEPLTGWFEKQLRQAATASRTPIQQATHACLIKTVNWVGEGYDLWKKNPERFHDYKQIQEDLNRLGYNCGPADGMRGAKTEACIQQFLTSKGIEEKELEGKIEEELKTLSSSPPDNPQPTTEKRGEEQTTIQPLDEPEEGWEVY